MCIVTMKTMTAAQRARRAANAAGVDCRIVSLDRNMTKNGCAYGLSYPCHMGEKLILHFERQGVEYGTVIGRDV